MASSSSTTGPAIKSESTSPFKEPKPNSESASSPDETTIKSESKCSPEDTAVNSKSAPLPEEPTVNSGSKPSPRVPTIKIEPPSPHKEPTTRSETSSSPELINCTTEYEIEPWIEEENDAKARLEASYPEYLLRIRENFDGSESKLQENFESPSSTSDDSIWLPLLTEHLTAGSKYFRAHRDWLRKKLHSIEAERTACLLELQNTQISLNKNDRHMLQMYGHARHHARHGLGLG